jgi:SAM-dependent methyltransferase
MNSWDLLPGRPTLTVSLAVVPDFRPAPNQGGNVDLYELENHALDPGGHVLAAMRVRAPWAGRTLLDLGCGSGYWLSGYADEAAEVIGVEPDPHLLPLAADRDSRVRVLHGSAEHIPLEDQSVDVVHARFAYFFPPGCDAVARSSSSGMTCGKVSLRSCCGPRGEPSCQPAGRRPTPGGQRGALTGPRCAARGVSAAGLNSRPSSAWSSR